MGSLEWALIQYNQDEDETARETTMWGHIEKVAICKPWEESLEETKAADLLILDFWSLELWESKCLLFEPPSL